MRFINARGQERITNIAHTPLFKIVWANKFTVEWLPDALEVLTTPRYKAKFSGIDLLRINAETVINVKCKETDTIYHVADILNHSVRADLRFNHIAAQAFLEVGFV